MHTEYVFNGREDDAITVDKTWPFSFKDRDTMTIKQLVMSAHAHDTFEEVCELLQANYGYVVTQSIQGNHRIVTVQYMPPG